jgi:hypothetical protein
MADIKLYKRYTPDKLTEFIAAMCKVIGMVAPYGSGVIEVMERVANALYDSGKRVTTLSSFRSIQQIQTTGVDYVVIKCAINEWKDLGTLRRTFGAPNLCLFTHVPLWKGVTRKGQVELVDLNWATWSAVYAVANSGTKISLENIRKTYCSGMEVRYHLPKMFREFKVISIANSAITSLSGSCKPMHASMDEIARIYKVVNGMNPSVEQMTLMIMTTI